jgi:N-acetylneuraminic acid mutarotase
MIIKHIFLIQLFSLIFFQEAFSQDDHFSGPRFKWFQLDSIPDKYGFAGSFAGIVDGHLLVAGGANFPSGGTPWTGSKKAWTDKIFILDHPGGQWKEAGKLPAPMGYGVSVTWGNKLICIGGSNGSGHSKKVISISYNKDACEISMLPDLSCTLANSCGALVNHTLYIAGGLVNSVDSQAASNFWSIRLDGAHLKNGWKKLPVWPGPPRMLSVAAVMKGSFFYLAGQH